MQNRYKNNVIQSEAKNPESSSGCTEILRFALDDKNNREFRYDTPPKSTLLTLSKPIFHGKSFVYMEIYRTFTFGILRI